MIDLPPDFVVEMRVVNGEPEVFVSIDGTTFHLHPHDAQALGWHVSRAAEAALHEVDADAHAPGAESVNAIPKAQEV